LYGIKRSEELCSQIELVEAYPAKIAEMLLRKDIDVGLVPVAVMPLLPQAHIIADYCIGADGDVASVCLFSDVPLPKIKKVLLDYQSRTSVMLAQILLKHFWKVQPLLQQANENYIDNIKGDVAGVVIGDRAFAQRKISKYVYDLAGAWKQMCGLPFVFAAWIAHKQLPADFITLFNNANAEGLQHVDAVIAENPYALYDLHNYYTSNISYRLDDKKQKRTAAFSRHAERVLKKYF